MSTYSVKHNTTVPQEKRAYNEFPPNMREISPSEFWHKMSGFVPQKIEFRQPLVKVDENYPFTCFWGDLILHYVDDQSGYAYTVNWDPSPHHKGPHDFWPRFFWFGPCRHTWKELTPSEAQDKGAMHFGMCYHVLECCLCKKLSSYDSSG